MNKRFLTIAAALSMGVALTAWYYVKKKDS